ncbi:type II 3-dehydroquinate dehydratase [Streptomyces californicus]|uniref:type II 3-dehydroquinate dehydratase n=1 Tax=Streptomyces californicus TaxID=67351 RepID=UPI003F557E20
MAEILLLNGPNLGQLGTRRPEMYGTTTLAEIERDVRKTAAESGHTVRCLQDESEATLVRAVHAAADCVGAIVNPGALMIAGWSLRDALESFPGPWMEVHLSNVFAREPFRHNSVISPLASGVLCGLGAYGYQLAALGLVHRLAQDAARSDGRAGAGPGAAIGAPGPGHGHGLGTGSGAGRAPGPGAT